MVLSFHAKTNTIKRFYPELDFEWDTGIQVTTEDPDTKMDVITSRSFHSLSFGPVDSVEERVGAPPGYPDPVDHHYAARRLFHADVYEGNIAQSLNPKDEVYAYNEFYGWHHRRLTYQQEILYAGEVNTTISWIPNPNPPTTLNAGTYILTIGDSEITTPASTLEINIGLGDGWGVLVQGISITAQFLDGALSSIPLNKRTLALVDQVKITRMSGLTSTLQMKTYGIRWRGVIQFLSYEDIGWIVHPAETPQEERLVPPGVTVDSNFQNPAWQPHSRTISTEGTNTAQYLS